MFRERKILLSIDVKLVNQNTREFNLNRWRENRIKNDEKMEGKFSENSEKISSRFGGRGVVPPVRRPHGRVEKYERMRSRVWRMSKC